MKLIEYLETINAQIFITTTESTVLKYLDSKILSVFEVENGFITPAIAKREEISLKVQDTSLPEEESLALLKAFNELKNQTPEVKC